ncbi:MAG: signal recognition particle protein, partial [Lachnospiraceae bacterium]|nr:signal recognition particle protein [Lachnospiraceae bacterium]
DEDAFKQTEAIINSMTKKEREKPDIITPPRKKRIANGSDVDIADVNRLMKQYEQTKKMMKQMNGMMKGGKFRRGGGKFPFGF